MAEAVRRAEARCKEAEAEAADERAARAEADEKRAAAEAEAAKVKAAADGRHEEAGWTVEAAEVVRAAATQTDGAMGVQNAGTQSTATDTRGGADLVCDRATQTEPRADAMAQARPAGVEASQDSAGFEVSVGRRLHPAQERALDRAERAAAHIERVQAEVEALAERYATKAEEQAATGSMASEGEQRVPTRTGGKQAKKARLRRQAAEARVDVAEWKAMREARVHLEEAAGGGRVLQTRLPPLGALPKRGAFGGEVRAEWSFLQAARAAGIAVEDAEVL